MKIEVQSNHNFKQWGLIVSFAFLICYALYVSASEASPEISIDSIKFQSVKSGPIDVYATVYGDMASAKERLLTAPAQGKVSSILIRPGTSVTPESVILTLSNPKLEQEVEEAKGELAQLQAQLEAFKYEQKSERLNYQSTIANIDAELEKAQLELSVNEDLLELGVASKLKLRRAKLAVKQQSKRLDFEQKKYQQFVEMQGFRLTQRHITIKQQESKLRTLQKQLDDMQVKAGITGSVQSLNVELGQSVTLGEAIAKIGSDKELIARLRIPQYQADQIDLNAEVSVNTSKGHIQAKISRIESVVTNGAVLAEAVLIGKLTSNSRPSLGVSAQIFLRHQPQANYIEQAPGFRPRSQKTIFVKKGDDLLVKRIVSLGELSNGQLIITNGLKAGEQIAITDFEEFSSFPQIEITQ